MSVQSKFKRSSQSLILLSALQIQIPIAQAQEITGQPAIPGIPSIVSNGAGELELNKQTKQSSTSTSELPDPIVDLEVSKGAELSPEGIERLAGLERRLFEHDFHSDKIPERLMRLEQLVFGSSTGGSCTERLNNLQSKTSEKKETASSSTSTIATPTVKAEKLTYLSAMDSGIANYKAARYHHAQEDFEKAIQLNPKAAEAYANLGGVFLMLRDRENAKEAFKACFMLQPFGKLGDYAKEKMLKIAEEDAYAKTNPQDTKITVERSMNMIDRQSGDRARMYQDAANRTAQYRINLANFEIQKLTNDPFYGITRYNRHGRATGYGNQDVSDWNYIKSNYLRTDGMVQANLALLDGNKKSTSVIESGANLKDQMLQPPSFTGGARLRALGTSLYARYYGDGLPSVVDPVMTDPAPAALQATAGSIFNTGH